MPWTDGAGDSATGLSRLKWSQRLEEVLQDPSEVLSRLMTAGVLYVKTAKVSSVFQLLARAYNLRYDRTDFGGDKAPPMSVLKDHQEAMVGEGRDTLTFGDFCEKVWPWLNIQMTAKPCVEPDSTLELGEYLEL